MSYRILYLPDASYIVNGERSFIDSLIIREFDTKHEAQHHITHYMFKIYKTNKGYSIYYDTSTNNIDESILKHLLEIVEVEE